MCFRIPKGFKSIAVGERWRDAHGGVEKRSERVKQSPKTVTPSGSDFFFRLSVGGPQRLPTAIDLNPSGMMR